jgi:cysteinyl-tRNA synthetase
MPLMLYNSLAKKEEPFEPADGKTVRMYTCGPTVYGRPHIANYSSFLMADLLRRWMEAGHGWTVIHAKNITDVGHLVRDADSGEDKIEKQAREEHGTVSHDSVIAIARKYEAMYLEDERALNMREPEHRPRATSFIEEMKEMIAALLKDGHAYVAGDGIYFDVTSFPAYGKLSGNSVDNLAAGARVDVNEKKKHPADFALWKFCVGMNEHHALRWTSPRGANDEAYPDGFPGWHIECSAMSRSLLGDTVDIHTGGEDNIFPHHECEIAQSESVTKKPFVRLWLHKRRIDLAGEKMSKSLGNVITIPDVVAKGYSPLDLRYLFLSVHYRTNLKFSWEALDEARKARKKIVEWMEAVHKNSVHAKQGESDGMASKTRCMFSDVMDADLNVSAALAEVFGMMNYYNAHHPDFTSEDYEELNKFLDLVRNTFGCFESEAQNIPQEIVSLAERRQTAKAEKDFAAADILRRQIEEAGYELRDTAEGPVIKKR